MCILIEHDNWIFHVKLYINNNEGKLFQKNVTKKKKKYPKIVYFLKSLSKFFKSSLYNHDITYFLENPSKSKG